MSYLETTQPSGLAAAGGEDPTRVRNKIFYAAAFCNVLVNLDHGIIPAATKEIKADLAISEAELGLMGSVVYAGFLVGSAFSGAIFQNYNTKCIVIAVITLYILSLLIFPLTTMPFFLGCSRFLVGFFQVN
jgi:MFS family permease